MSKEGSRTGIAGIGGAIETLDDEITTLLFGFEIESGRFVVRGAAPSTSAEVRLRCW